MRIAFVAEAFPELSETFIARHAVGLLDRGHDVTIFSHRRPQSRLVHESFRERGLQERVRYVQPAERGALGLGEALLTLLEVPRALPAARFLMDDSPRRLGGLRPMLMAIRALRRWPAPDILHCHFGDLALGYRFARALWRIPLVASFYGYDVTKFPRGRKHVYEPLFRAAAAVVALGPSMASRLEAMGCPADRLEIVGLGVDTTRFAFRERTARRDGGPVRLLTVARLVEKKGIEYALEAIARVGVRHPNLTYDVIGDGPRRKALAERANRLGLGDRVFFHGARTEAGVRQAMEDADLFLLPSVTATDGDEEGTPTVLLEASSVGLPILSTRHSGIPEIVIDGVTGYLAPERDPVTLAENLTKLLNDPSSWCSMGRAGRQHVVRNYDQTVLSERLEGVYRRVLKAHHSPGW